MPRRLKADVLSPNIHQSIDHHWSVHTYPHENHHIYYPHLSPYEYQSTIIFISNIHLYPLISTYIPIYFDPSTPYWLANPQPGPHRHRRAVDQRTQNGGDEEGPLGLVEAQQPTHGNLSWDKGTWRYMYHGRKGVVLDLGRWSQSHIKVSVFLVVTSQVAKSQSGNVQHACW